MAELGLDSDLAAQFRLEKTQLQRLRDQRAAREAALSSNPAEADVTSATDFLQNLLDTLSADVETARALLHTHLGTILMTPKQEGQRRYYLATAGIDVSAALEERAAEESLIEELRGQDLNL